MQVKEFISPEFMLQEMAMLQPRVNFRLQAAPPSGSRRSPAHFVVERGLFVLATVASILIATIIGMIDDLLGWRTGIRQSKKVLLTFLIL